MDQRLYLPTFEGVEGGRTHATLPPATCHLGPIVMQSCSAACSHHAEYNVPSAELLPSVYILSVVGTGRGCVILDVIMHHGPQDGRYSGHNAMSGCSNLPTSIRTPRLLGQPGLLSFWFSLGFYYCTFRFVFGRKNMENESIYYIRNLYIWAQSAEHYNQMVRDQLLRP